MENHLQTRHKGHLMGLIPSSNKIIEYRS